MAGFAAILTTLWLILGVIALENATPAYRRRHRTISELGSRGIRWEIAARYALFLPVGASTGALAIWWWVTGNWPAGVLAGALATGYLSAALYPADRGSPLGGSLANRLHNLGGLAMYLGGALALLLAAPQQPVNGLFAAMLLLMIPTLGPNDPTGHRGYAQRLMEALMFAQLCRFSID